MSGWIRLRVRRRGSGLRDVGCEHDRDNGAEIDMVACMDRVGRYVPGIIYVKERSADSSCETWLAFLVTKSSYMASHFGGRARVLRRFARGGDHLVLVCASAGVDMTGRCESSHEDRQVRFQVFRTGLEGERCQSIALMVDGAGD